MKALHRRCAGLDVHQQEIVACRRIVAGRKVQTEVGRFSTTTQGLLELANWRTGWRTARSRTSPWRRQGSTGSRSGTFFMVGSR